MSRIVEEKKKRSERKKERQGKYVGEKAMR